MCRLPFESVRFRGCYPLLFRSPYPAPPEGFGEKSQRGHWRGNEPSQWPFSFLEDDHVVDDKHCPPNEWSGGIETDVRREDSAGVPGPRKRGLHFRLSGRRHATAL